MAAAAIATTRARGYGWLALGLLWPVLLAVPATALAQPPAAQSTAKLGQHGAEPARLRCRVEQGPWRDCHLVVEQIGSAWSLQVGPERFAFTHDGRGQVRMQRGQTDWVTVQARWGQDASLCWDGICAIGDLPLD
jgi:hypothetical protein